MLQADFQAERFVLACPQILRILYAQSEKAERAERQEKKARTGGDTPRVGDWRVPLLGNILKSNFKRGLLTWAIILNIDVSC